jgi:hypothetical protein
MERLPAFEPRSPGPEPGIPSQPFSLRILSQGFLATCGSVRKKGFWPLDYGAIGFNNTVVYLKFSDKVISSESMEYQTKRKMTKRERDLHLRNLFYLETELQGELNLIKETYDLGDSFKRVNSLGNNTYDGIKKIRKKLEKVPVDDDDSE